MKASSKRNLARGYSFERRRKSGKLSKARKFVSKKFSSSRILLIGFGGTISSGYTPTRETIVPLHPSPAIKQIDYINLFATSNLKYDHLDLLAKDSRELTKNDIEILLDIIHLVPNRKVLITAGTYMLPKLAEVIASAVTVSKVVVLTGSILPAGFVASDADANIWSAITALNMEEAKKAKGPRTHVVFHGRVFSTLKEFKNLNLHPKKMRKMVIQYPLSSVPVEGVL